MGLIICLKLQDCLSALLDDGLMDHMCRTNYLWEGSARMQLRLLWISFWPSGLFVHVCVTVNKPHFLHTEHQTGGGPYTVVGCPQDETGTSLPATGPSHTADWCAGRGEKLTRGKYWLKISIVKRGVLRCCVGGRVLHGGWYWSKC